MSMLIFAVWVVLLDGQFFRLLDATENAGCVLDKPHDVNPDSCENVWWSDMAPRTCKNVGTNKNRAVVKLAEGFVVLCDAQTDGGGWIVFQRRVSSDVDFYRNWDDYKYGFGNIIGSFWLGNEKIHRLTFQRPHELRIDFTFNGRSYFARYSKFRIFGEAEKYALEVEGYSGNAGDSMANQNKMAFGTKDRDNDLHVYGNCAVLYHGGWWFNNCHTCHLNGEWGAKKFGEGLPWRTITTITGSVTSTEMKIRPLG